MPMPSVNQPLKQHHGDYLSLVEISDLHLFHDPHKHYNHINPHDSLNAVLTVIKRQFNDIDLMVLTGDLLQEPNSQNYDQLFAKLDSYFFNYVAIPGNHDVTLELDSHLPFVQRRHLPTERDERLLSCQVITTPYWDLVFLDSTVKGQIYGEFSQETLKWLKDTLAASDKPCVIFAHHPMVKVNSYWLDHHRLRNATAFWQVVVPFRHRLKGIFVGHVHQECQVVYEGIPLFTAPATSRQFKPFAHDYAIDDLPAGFRWLTLYNNGKLATGVKRIDTM